MKFSVFSFDFLFVFGFWIVSYLKSVRYILYENIHLESEPTAAALSAAPDIGLWSNISIWYTAAASYGF